jgi:DNA-binding NarL/FixJ family response regulator
VASLAERAASPPIRPAGKTTAPSGTHPAGLSAREVEVLRLLTQGLTNPQIAGRLVLSTFTVNAHLRNIYAKLGVSSRAAATGYAHRHGLVGSPTG